MTSTACLHRIHGARLTGALTVLMTAAGSGPSLTELSQ